MRSRMALRIFAVRRLPLAYFARFPILPIPRPALPARGGFCYKHVPSMKNFLRALKFAYPYRGRLLLSLLCALLAAVFWSLNFTAIYPVLKTLGSDKNLQQWVADAIDEVKSTKVNPLQIDVNRLSKEREELEKDPLQEKELRRRSGDLARYQSKLEDATEKLYQLQVAKKYIDWFFPTDRFQTLALILGLVVAAVALRGFFEFWQETFVGNVVNRSLFDLRNRFYRKVLHLDVNQFSDAGTGELMARFTNDMETLSAGTKTLFGRVVAEPLKAVGCIVVACWISWKLTLMFLVLVPLAILILSKVGRVMKRATRKLLERMSSIYKILQETFVGIRIVKAYTREPAERQRFREATNDYYHKAMWVVILDALAGPIIELLGVAAVAGALLVGAYLVMNKETEIFGINMTTYPLEPETLMQLYVLLAAIADPVRKLSSVFARIQAGAAAADRIFKIMDAVPTVQANTDGPRLARHGRDVEFRNVCFSYEPGQPILTGIHLHVRHGEIIALVGPNGCGKSTLVNLLPRFYDPDHGSIYIDGINLRKANLRSVRHQVAMVTQETILFDETAFNNIAYGHPGATVEEVELAAKQAYAHDFIVKLPNGYQTRIGEAGLKLSGGQKQRLALARAMLRNPSILILDEFTSQTDAESEALIHKALKEFTAGRTTFFVTHRLNTLEIANRIVVLDAGRVLSVGTHQELLASCTLYQRLHEAHFQRLVA